MYKIDALREYIEKSELRVFSNKIKVRLSKKLASRYDQGCYNNYLSNMLKYIDMIDTLGIKYPKNATPFLYVYIVPDNNYSELLGIPKAFDDGTGGGKPVKCYDLDGFNWAYGLSSNILENDSLNKSNISIIENEIHELSHIIHSEFFTKNQSICEGIAETIPLYILNFEDLFDEHKNIIKELDESKILSIRELIDSEKDGSYGVKSIIPNKMHCSFRISYISSYLFVRGCIEKILKNNNCSKIQALQKFLEILKFSNYSDEYLIFDIANAIGVSQEELLNGKEMQLKLINSFNKIIIV